jgi:hypothetical protein
MSNKIQTNNGDKAFEHSQNHFLEFFSKAGSLMEKRTSAYGNETSALELFKPCIYADLETSLKLLFWLRDIRGVGAGNRSGFRSCLTWLANEFPDHVNANIELIAQYGRFDDLLALYDTPCQNIAMAFWASAIRKGDGLACKWAGRKDWKLRNFMKMSPKVFRKMLVAGTNVVEQKMCAKQYNQIEYPTVPSVAMSRYTNAFTKNDAVRYSQFKNAVVNGEAKVNTGALFPHDCMRTVSFGDPELANLQFDNLKNILNANERAIVMADFSGSMSSTIVAGSTTAFDVSFALALYISSRMPKDSYFYKKFMAYSMDCKLVDWNGMKFSDAVRVVPTIPGIVGFNTDIATALKTLRLAAANSVTKEDIPSTLIIVSDMQFDHDYGSIGNGQIPITAACRYDESVVEAEMQLWEQNGMKRPKIIFWNTAGYAGQQTQMNNKHVAMISGFSPQMLSIILKEFDYTPYKAMMKVLENYTVKLP